MAFRTLFAAFILSNGLAAAAAASTVLADFDAGSPTFNLGTVSGRLQAAPLGGSGSLPGGSAGGGILTGNLLNGVDRLVFEDRDFDQIKSVSFSLAAFRTGSATFETSDSITVTAAGNVVARFIGINGGIGFDAVEGVTGQVTPTFSDFTVSGINERGYGVGDLVFDFQTSTVGENVAIDAVSIAPIPLPASALMLIAALGATGVVLRGRRT
ncbi:MAG: VPLPA-CTERM sorting domain-containing protein [Pseudomonadota bacterium]